jgi:ElaB/YqjD/DUF883 family membrane-anchored ribosome-binding protein
MSDHPFKSVADAGAAVAGSVENAVSSAFDSGTDAANYAGRHARQAGSDFQGFVRQNPLAAVGGALALGALLGMLAGRRTGG